MKAVHRKIKDFFSSQCNYRASDPRSDMLHEKAVHDRVRDFACGKCGYETVSLATLNRHVKAAHKKSQERVHI